jgi:ABC-type nitrate/sulfonate/bicarbonate transport system substrate-binding protein
MAVELGLFHKHRIEVRLSRELGWASIRDKVVYGELDAAHAVSPLPFVITAGPGAARCECLAALVLNLHGNGITLSDALWEAGVRDAAGLRMVVRRMHGQRMLTFGVVSRFSSHHFLLRTWLAAAGLQPDRDCRIVVVPPPQMVPNLRSGNLDGFCVGEPWNSVAVQSRVGWCAAVSAELAPGHPEKVLMTRSDFALRCAGEHLALVAALREACAYCDQPDNHEHIARVLSRPEYVGVPPAVLLRGLTGEFDFGHGRLRTVPDFTVFSRDDANEPSADKAGRVLQWLRAGAAPAPTDQWNAALARRVFRVDLFSRAVSPGIDPLCLELPSNHANEKPTNACSLHTSS